VAIHCQLRKWLNKYTSWYRHFKHFKSSPNSKYPEGTPQARTSKITTRACSDLYAKRQTVPRGRIECRRTILSSLSPVISVVTMFVSGTGGASEPTRGRSLTPVFGLVCFSLRERMGGSMGQPCRGCGLTVVVLVWNDFVRYL
jgi:hypothetical protein